MSRTLRWMAVMAWACAAVVGAAWAADEKAPAEKPAQTPSANAWGSYGLPGFYRLQVDSVQKDLAITPEQTEKFKKIAEDYYAGIRDEQKVDWKKIREMPTDEQKKYYDEMRKRYTDRIEGVKNEVEKVLLPEQLEKLKKMEERDRVSMLLYSPQVLDQIGLSEQQKETIRKVREQAQDKMLQVQRESVDKTYEVLTPEQLEKLKGLSAKGVSGNGQPGQTTEQPEKK